MYAVYYNECYEIFDSLLEAETYVEYIWNRDGIKLEIEPYHWTMEQQKGNKNEYMSLWLLVGGP